MSGPLLAVRIMLNSTILKDMTPSYIVELFGKYCPNLRSFDIQHFQCEPVSQSAISAMLKNCPKFDKLDVPAESNVLSVLHQSKVNIIKNFIDSFYQ